MSKPIVITRYLVSTALVLVGALLISFSLPSGSQEFAQEQNTKNISVTELYEGAALEEKILESEDTKSNTEISLNSVPVIPKALESHIYPSEYEGEITFTGGEVVFPKTNIAISRAFSSVGDALSVCMDGRCFNKCDHLAGDIWGYEEASGYYSAFTHWQTAVAQGIAVVDDREPPLGALLFWETGRPFGHVATYIGNGMVVTNAGGEYGSNVYIYYADWYDVVGYKYLGWAPPVFFGEEPGSAL
jgi:hypothetical protein